MTQLISTPSPVTIGLDIGDRTTHLCVVNESREFVRERSCPTTRGELLRELADFPGARVVLEAGSQSPWISRTLRAAGYVVHVADPRRVQLISKDRRKTDRRDARTLALLESGCPELLGEVFHRGEQAQADLSIVRARDLVVRMRTMAVQQVRSLSKAFGVRLPSASTRTFATKVRALVPDVLRPAVQPVLELIEDLTERIRGLDRLLLLSNS
jgi:transposase